MTLEQALDFLATNCPQVFKPISEEMADLRKEKDKLKEELSVTQDAVNSILFDTMSASETEKEV